MESNDIKKTSIEELLSKLSTTKNGLSSSEAQKRITQYGYNEIQEKKVNPLVKFLRYFWGPIPWMIEAAVVMSAVINHWEDFFIILALLIINAIVGFWQEYKADNAIELLKQKLAPEARVIRDGQWKQLPARQLVPGDIVRIRLGDIVPADIKLMTGEYLSIDESALTGESLPVEKHASDIAYDGSVIRQGEMDGLVVNTGTETFFGKTTTLVEKAKTQSHFQKAIVKIGNYLILLAVLLVVLIFFIALFRHESMLQTLQFALVLTVAAIPAALPAVLSVTMAVGAIALAKKEAIVSKLVSIEEMAGMDVLCSDKTGTITKNQLTVGTIFPSTGFTEKDVLVYATLASREENKDPIDDAIINKSKEYMEEIKKNYSVKKFKPFDPVSKRTEAVLDDSSGNHFSITKGAPQIVLSLNPSDSENKKIAENQVNSFALKGNRTIAVAKTDPQNNWKLIGLIGLYDPPRDDSAETIQTAQKMGVKVKMITGDHGAIAEEIAREVKMGTHIISASTFVNKNDTEAQRIIESSDGFSEVFPEHKYHIVELLQSRGHIVGMTGDGVNDAPALKKADAGIAVAGATDAAKSAAAIVLTKPGLSVIIDAIKESRKIFQRMNNYAIYRMSETIRVLFFITLSIVVFGFYPITALMIVLLAILNDLPVMTISYDNVKYSDEPEKWNMRTLLGIATFLGTIGVISSFGLLYIGRDIFHLSPTVLQSFIYLKLSVAGHTVLLIARTKSHFWSIRPAPILLIAVIGTQLTATIITVYGILLPAMGWGLALFVWGYALLAFVITDFLKIYFYRLLNHNDITFKRQTPSNT